MSAAKRLPNIHDDDFAGLRRRLFQFCAAKEQGQ
jgi:hypothetical protein